MDNPIVYYGQKEGKSLNKKGAISMKKNIEMNRKYNSGYEMMGKAMSVSTMRAYWKGSPWKALWNSTRGE